MRLTTQPATKLFQLDYVKTIGIVNNGLNGRGFANPYDTAVSKDGRIFVLNRCDAARVEAIRVGICNLEEDYLGEFGKGFGTGDEQFGLPTAMAFDSQDRLYITDEYLHRVTVFDSSGNFLSKWGEFGSDEGQLAGPSGIAFDSQDNLYLSDTYNNRIQKFTSDGRFQASFGAEGNGKLNLPWGLTVDSQDNVFVADWGNDQIKKFSSDGKFLAQYGSSGRGAGEFTRPSSVAVDNDGYIYVADWGNERVQVLDHDGRFVQKLRGEATHSKWAEDFLGVNVEEAEARARADLEKDIEFFVDTPHEESSHIEKYFWGPASLLFDTEGRLFVTETHRHRIQVYERGD